jgi:tyrosine-protein kinase Etk/Wzc
MIQDPTNYDSALGTDSRVSEEEISPLDILIVLAKRKKLILAVPLAASLVAVVIALWLPKIYTAQARIMPPQQRESSAVAALSALTGIAGGAGATVGQALGLKNPNELYVGILKGHTIADRMIERFDLKERFRKDTILATRKALDGRTTIAAGRDGLITIEVDDEDPKHAADMANAYIEELDRTMQALAITEASQRRLFLERHLTTAREQLIRAEVVLRQAITEKGLVAVDAQSRAVVGTMERLRAEIAARQIQLDAMRTFATERNPDSVRLKQEITSIQSELTKLEGGSRSSNSKQVGDKSGSPAGLENIRLLRETKFLESMVELLTKQFEAAKIDEAQDAAMIQIVDKAIPPDFKSKPRRALIVILTGVIAGFLAVMSAFIMEALERARNNPQSARRLKTLWQYLRWR